MILRCGVMAYKDYRFMTSDLGWKDGEARV